MAALLLNPIKRRRKKARRKSTGVAVAKRARRSVSRAVGRVVGRVKRYRRNPLPKMGSTIQTVKNGALGAAGAILSEVVLTKLPLPVSMQSGTGLIVAKALVGVGIGYAAGKVSKDKSIGRKMAEGSITIALHESMRNLVKGPLGLAGMDDGLLGNDLLGYYADAPVMDPIPNGVGAYYENDTQY